MMRSVASRLLGGAVVLLIVVSLVLGAGVATRYFHNRLAERSSTPLHVRVSGTGEPVLLIHGLVGSGAFWDEIAPDLARRHLVLVPDLLGFGASPWPRSDYTLADHLIALDQTVAAMVHDAPVSIVAHSMGTQLAVSYALRRPGRVQRLVLIGPPLFRSREEALAASRRSSPVLSMMSFSPVLTPVLCLLHEALRPLLRVLMPHVLRDVPRNVAADAVQHTWDSFLGSLDNVVIAADLRQLLPEVRGIPILILQGDTDTNASADELDRLANAHGGRFVRLPGDHNFILSRKQPALGMIEAFLRE